jgi:hypothetical protein
MTEPWPDIAAGYDEVAAITALIQAAGLTVGWSQQRDPYPGEITQRLYLWARLGRRRAPE